MKCTKVFAFLLALMLLIPYASLAESAESAEGIATPAMDMSLEEAVQQGLLTESDLQLEEPAHPFCPPDVMDKTIFGEDDRELVRNPQKYPYSAIAYLVVEASCGCDWTATGFMVSRDGMMTGAHCVVCSTHGGTATKITMFFGYESGKDYLYRYTGGTTYWYGTTFQNNDGSYSYSPHVNWDYAYLKLEKNVGDTTGWFGTKVLSDYEVSGQVLEVAGFRNGYLRKGSGSVSVRNDYCIKYTIDTLPGNSGCPVFDEDYYVVAINVASNDSFNTARRITSDLFYQMKDNDIFE